jgi:hypothetical protein
MRDGSVLSPRNFAIVQGILPAGNAGMHSATPKGVNKTVFLLEGDSDIYEKNTILY